MSEVTRARAVWLSRHVLQHEPSLRAWLSRRRLGDLDVDDVVQEAYSRLIATEDLDAIRAPKAYFFQTARSVIASHVRRAKIVQIQTVADLDLMELVSEEPSAEDQLHHRDELQRLAEAIAQLPEPTQSVFRLRRIERLSQGQIAQRLGLTERMIERHMSRALVFMFDRLGYGGTGSGLASKTVTEGGSKSDGQADRARGRPRGG